MKKIISMLITITLIAASTAFVFAEKGEISQNEVGKIKEFTDLTKHWAKSYIDKLIALETINGYEDGTFKPDNPIKVGEFTKILINSLGYKDLENSTEGHWSLNYINKAKELGLIEEGEFSLTELDRNINRGEMARMIIRASKEEYPENIGDYKEIIKDYIEIPKEYQDYALKAFIKGIITGYEDGTFKYDKTATRAEASTMIIRFLDEEERKVPRDYEIRNTKFWKEGIKAVKEYLKEQKKKNPDEFFYSYDETMRTRFKYTEKDIDNAFNMAYDFAMDMHNYSYKKDTDELRQKLSEKYRTSIDGKVNPWLIDLWWDFAKADKAIKKAIFVADKGSLYKNKYLMLRGRLYFKYDNLERSRNFNELDIIWHERYLGRERFAEKGHLYNVEAGKWYYKDMDVEINTKVYAFHGYEKEGVTYHFTIPIWDKHISIFKEVSKDIEEELEKYVEGR